MSDEAEFKGQPYEIMLVLLGVWCVLIVALIIAFAIAHYTMSWSYVVYDLCTSSEGSFFYSVKIKTGRLHKELIDGNKFMTLDLLGTSGNFVTRLVVPFFESIKNKTKAETQDTVTITFKVGRKRRLPDIGRIRVDHELWQQQVFVQYVDIKSLNEDEGARHFRCNVNQGVTMLTPAEVDVTKYQKDQVFLTEHDVNYPGGRPTVYPNITLPEGMVFFLFAAIIGMSMSYCVPRFLGQDTANDEGFRLAAYNGIVSSLVGLLIGLLLMLLFKFFLKQRRTMLGMSLTGRFTLITLLLITAVGLTIFTGINSYNGRVSVQNWSIALGIGALILFVVGLPLGFVIEIMSRKRSGRNMVREESTMQAPSAGPSRVTP